MKKSKNARLSLPHEPICADFSDTPIIICDKNEQIIYKNSSSYLSSFPRKGANILSFMNDRDREKYCSVKNSECICEGISIISHDDVKDGFVCRYKPYSLETFFIFPRCIGGFTSREKIDSFKKYISELAVNIDYGNVVCKKERKVLSAAELIRQSNFSCLSSIMSLSKSLRLRVADFPLVVRKFLENELMPDFFDISIIDDPDIDESLTVENSEIFLSVFLNMLTLLLDDEGKSIKLSAKCRGSSAVLECLMTSRKEISKKTDDIASLSEVFPEGVAEISIMKFICSEFGFDLTLMPYYSGRFNTLISLSCKAARRNIVRENDTDNEMMPYLKFISFLKSNRK